MPVTLTVVIVRRTVSPNAGLDLALAVAPTGR
jgi:hypothetical protein